MTAAHAKRTSDEPAPREARRALSAGVPVDPDCAFEVAWSLDGGGRWWARLSGSLADARAFARRLASDNVGNPRFWCCAKRLVALSYDDFLLSDKRAVEIAVADRLTLPEGYAGEGRR